MIWNNILHNIFDKTFSDTLLWIYKSLNLNIFSDLRKSGLVPDESLSLSAKIDSVLEKYPYFIMTNRMRSIHMKYMLLFL